jgi:Flp pilus assembly protein TadD
MGAHYERANLLFLQRRYAQAEQELREELAENPHNGTACAFLGYCLAQQKRLTEAVEACEEGVRLAPAAPHVLYLLGLTYLDCGRLKEAEGALREALRLNPRNATYLEWLSWVQFRRGDRAGALATVEQGLAINPQHVGCLSHHGQYKRVLGNWREAEETLRVALTLNPENDLTHAQLAWALYVKALARARSERKVGSWPWRPEMAEALQHCQEALRLNPCSDFAKTTMTEVLLAPARHIFVAIGLLSGMAALGALILLAMASVPAGQGPHLSPQAIGFVKGTLLVLCGILTVGISNGPPYLLLRWSRLGASVLSPARRWAANGTILCLTGAAVAVATPPPAACAALFLSLALVQPLTNACQATPGWPRKLLIAYSALLAGIGLACLASICAGDKETLSPAVAALAVWVTTASILSRVLAPFLEKRLARKPV